MEKYNIRWWEWEINFSKPIGLHQPKLLLMFVIRFISCRAFGVFVICILCMYNSLPLAANIHYIWHMYFEYLCDARVTLNLFQMLVAMCYCIVTFNVFLYKRSKWSSSERRKRWQPIKGTFSTRSNKMKHRLFYFLPSTKSHQYERTHPANVISFYRFSLWEKWVLLSVYRLVCWFHGSQVTCRKVQKLKIIFIFGFAAKIAQKYWNHKLANAAFVAYILMIKCSSVYLHMSSWWFFGHETGEYIFFSFINLHTTFCQRSRSCFSRQTYSFLLALNCYVRRRLAYIELENIVHFRSTHYRRVDWMNATKCSKNGHTFVRHVHSAVVFTVFSFECHCFGEICKVCALAMVYGRYIIPFTHLFIQNNYYFIIYLFSSARDKSVRWAHTLSSDSSNNKNENYKHSSTSPLDHMNGVFFL